MSPAPLLRSESAAMKSRCSPRRRARATCSPGAGLSIGASGADVIAVGPSIPLSRRTHMGIPVAVRANLRLALARGHFDVVHGFEPGLPSISYLALTSTRALTAATFFSPERLGYPARRSRRDRLRIRIDALLATSSETADAAGSGSTATTASFHSASTRRAFSRPPSATSSSASSRQQAGP